MSFDIDEDNNNSFFFKEDYEDSKYVEREMIIIIKEYYNYQKQIEFFFSKGINQYITNTKEQFYFIDSKWLKKWKLFINGRKKI